MCGIFHNIIQFSLFVKEIQKHSSLYAMSSYMNFKHFCEKECIIRSSVLS